MERRGDGPGRPRGLTALLLVGIACSAGCANFRHLNAELKRAEARTTLHVRVQAKEWSGNPIVLFVMQPASRPGMPIPIVTVRTLERPGRTHVALSPGQYMVGAFEDISRDMRLQLGQEAVGVYRNLEPFSVGGEDDEDHISLQLQKEPPREVAKVYQNGTRGDRSAVQRSEGLVVPLSDPRFDPSHAKVGVWKPVTFIETVGSGVFMLQEYDPAKTPVLFVHGMGGHPREFSSLVESLDKTQFQPWVAFYPSGWRLTDIAEALDEILRAMHTRLRFTRMQVVAHSMGGLVARRMLAFHQQSGEPFISHLVTLVAPLGGIASADKGVKMAPTVVPAWRDIGPSSDYVQELYSHEKPACTRYTLVFAYGNSGRNEASDGVVPVSSQLRWEAQQEATHEAGFESTHLGVLSHEQAVQYVTNALTHGDDAGCRVAVEVPEQLTPSPPAEVAPALITSPVR